MELTQKHYDLIKDIIKNNPRIQGNEDLLEDCCTETINRIYSIISSFDNVDNIEVYINKVASSAIFSILKNQGRFKKTQENQVEIIQQQDSFEEAYIVDKDRNIIFDIPDPLPYFCGEDISSEEAELMKKVILNIQSAYKDDKYLDIFVNKYFNELSQHEVAYKLGISYSEVSQKLVELAKKVSEYLK